MPVNKEDSKSAAVRRLHSLHVDNNKKLTASGVVNVKSYNDKEINLILSEYILVVNGEGLNIDKLSVDDGSVVVDGLILSLRYLKTAERGSFFKRLTK
ncbi:MAG: YabP/YqfC family sporulation protein [Clostridiales bacterium]|jgi:sporulation protein YabP|nr:YabP/YqfC family sporulation protein [Clostridiales bacterium]